MRRRAALLVMLAAAFAAACDRTPIDPLGDGADHDLQLSGAAVSTAAPLSLPSLLQSAILRVYTDHGAEAARALVTDLRRLQESARTAAAAGDRETAAAHRRALRAEELGIVLRVFGDDIAARVIVGVNARATVLEARLAEASAAGGPDFDRTRDLLAQARELIVDAGAAWESGAPRPALDAATRAAALVQSVRQALAASLHVRGLDDLFTLAVHRLRETGGAEAVHNARVRLEQLQREAQEAVRSGDRQLAHEALSRVRAERIAIILRVSGPDAARHMIAQATAAATSLEAEVTALHQAGTDVTRLQRMVGTAHDMLERATGALAAGDAAAALDLGGHAAGLLNTARSAVASL